MSGGPEIDFGIYTETIVLLGEAKWFSSVDTAQGQHGDRDQIQLRIEFLNKFGRRIFTFVKEMIVVGIGLENNFINTGLNEKVQCVGITWDEVSKIWSHPLADEVKRYFEWKKRYSTMDF